MIPISRREVLGVSSMSVGILCGCISTSSEENDSDECVERAVPIASAEIDRSVSIQGTITHLVAGDEESGYDRRDEDMPCTYDDDGNLICTDGDGVEHNCEWISDDDSPVLRADCGDDFERSGNDSEDNTHNESENTESQIRLSDESGTAVVILGPTQSIRLLEVGQCVCITGVVYDIISGIPQINGQYSSCNK